MAATISISCPKCSKTVQAPASVKGKKIKCKGCGEQIDFTQCKLDN